MWLVLWIGVGFAVWTDSLDVGPVMVRGQVKGHRCRVLWTEGTLYVVHSANRITTLETVEPVQDSNNGQWVAATDTGTVTFTRNGCSSCGYRLGSIPVEQITG